jgi:hypothetical protein
MIRMDISQKQHLIHYPILTHIFIDKCCADFNKLETFISNVSRQLQVLCVMYSNDIAYLDADRWERIISQHLLHLRIFELKYEETIDVDLETTIYHKQLNRFNSSFWMKRKWFLKTQTFGLIILSLIPYLHTGILKRVIYASFSI